MRVIDDRFIPGVKGINLARSLNLIEADRVGRNFMYEEYTSFHAHYLACLLIAALLVCTAAHSAEPEPAIADEPQAGTKIVHPIDQAVMVYVPAGWFTMGLDQRDANDIARQLGADNYETLWMWEAMPRRKVYAGGFFIDQYELTIVRWLAFMKANPKFTLANDKMSHHFANPRLHVYPVAAVQWHEAQRYANWSGKRLPTETQWEKAARGTDGRFFPWGNQFDLRKGNFQRTKATYARVGLYPEGASPFGVMDMVGNQYEYTSEWVEPYPNNPEAKRMKAYWAQQNVCLRGGSWYHGQQSCYAAKRFGLPQGTTYYHVGFRTVWEPPAGYFKSDAFKKARKAVPAREKELQQAFALFDATKTE
mgnify:FL=1